MPAVLNTTRSVEIPLDWSPPDGGNEVLEGMPSQLVAWSADAGVVAVANGPVVDVYHFAALAMAKSDISTTATAESHAAINASARLQAHVPFLQHISLREHVESHYHFMTDTSKPMPSSATCVAFAERDLLFVGAVGTSDEGTDDDAPWCSWLLGFRLYVSAASSSALVHLLFVEEAFQARGGIGHIELCSSLCDTTLHEGTAVMISHASNQIALFRWAERFSDRVLCVAAIPQCRDAVLTSVAVDELRAHWCAVGDSAGNVLLLDLRTLAWDSATAVRRLESRRSVSGSGSRLQLLQSWRSGIAARTNPLEDVRCAAIAQGKLLLALMHLRRTGLLLHELAVVADGSSDVAPMAHCWLIEWSDSSACYLIRRVDLNSAMDQFRLETLQVYPGLSSADCVRWISKLTPTDVPDLLEFTTVSKSTWKVWNVTGKPASPVIQLPSLVDALNAPQHQLPTKQAQQVLGPATIDIDACNGQEADVPSQNQSLLVVTAGCLYLVEHAQQARSGDSEIANDTASDAQSEHTPEESQQNGHHDVDDNDTASNALKVANSAAVKNLERPPETIQERFQLPPARFQSERSPTIDALPEQLNAGPSCDGETGTHVTRVEYEQRLAHVVHRVERMNDTVKALRNSFQLFTQETQRHMSAMNEKLELLLDLHAREESADRSIASAQTKHRADSEALSFHNNVMDRSYLDDGRGRRSSATVATNNQLQHGAYVPHLADKYDPDHPDADWGGVVQRSYKKRYFDNHGRDNLTSDVKGGLMPHEAAPVAGSSFSGKRMFESEHIPSGDASIPGIPFTSAVYQVGPGGSTSASDWKSTYAAQTSMEATPKENFALGSKQNAQHKRHVTPLVRFLAVVLAFGCGFCLDLFPFPQYEQAQAERKASTRSSSPYLDNNQSSSSSRGSSPAGLTSTSSAGSLSGQRPERRSLLAGIGKLVAAEDIGDKLARAFFFVPSRRPEHHLSQAYSDPTNKNLLTEN
ncbi:TPA: hypothetical protein N0F65_006629 [Lagenidium giganteum]|uniref:Uncharacterized protein n=1 Tax=Lagenidium giganteum TaxID=4803 RepID=A0AAV2ZBG7_9STRA|nr:TPA: hypothetical protein N0F65_006629 [Lagenidium giganteum]